VREETRCHCQIICPFLVKPNHAFLRNMQKPWLNNLIANIVGGLVVVVIITGISFLRSEQVVRLLGGVPNSEFRALETKLSALETRMNAMDVRTGFIDKTPTGEAVIHSRYADLVFSDGILETRDPNSNYVFWSLDGAGQLYSYCDSCPEATRYSTPSKTQRKKP
jgi:hypothetical protein